MSWSKECSSNIDITGVPCPQCKSNLDGINTFENENEHIPNSPILEESIGNIILVCEIASIFCVLIEHTYLYVFF